MVFFLLLIWAWVSVTYMKLASLSTLSCKAKAGLSLPYRFFQRLTWSVVPLSLSNFLGLPNATMLANLVEGSPS